MPLTLLLGGARSGKSRLAVLLAEASGRPVVVIATAEARDDEMAERIRCHRKERPSAWGIKEEPLELDQAMDQVGDDACVLLDCLTLWVSNLLEEGLSDVEIEDRSKAVAGTAAARTAETIVVTNEVGSGIVPTNASARRYADVLGRVNAIWAKAADRAALVVAGRILPLSSTDPPGDWTHGD